MVSNICSIRQALHRLEDAHDVAEAAKAREDVRKHGAIPWEAVKAELRDA
jgi:hypothetical protein